MTVLAYVITAYGQRRTIQQIAKLLARVPAERRLKLEVVVVDDKPEAQEGEKIGSDFAPLRFGRLVVAAHRANAGVAAARNTGISLVRSPWVTFLDGDDLLMPWHSEDFIAAAESAPAGVAGIDCPWLSWKKVWLPDDQDIAAIAGHKGGPLVLSDGQHSIRKPWAGGPLVDKAGFHRPMCPAAAHRTAGLPRFSDLFGRVLRIGGEDVDFRIRSLGRGTMLTTSRPAMLYRLLGQLGHAKHYSPSLAVESALIRFRARALYRDNGEAEAELKTSEIGRTALAVMAEYAAGRVEYCAPPFDLLRQEEP